MMRLQDIATQLQATLIGEDVTIRGVETDSRRVAADQLFVALMGANFDGHDFIDQVAALGAVAAMVSKPVSSPIPTLLVKDTRLAMGRLAASWRAQLGLPLIAVTGSNGKTTTKEMIAAILQQHTGIASQVLATAGNFNNDIGMPLTLLKLTAEHRYAVIEMGMNHLGEIDYLTHLAQPDVAMIINAGTAHIGELGSRENIAQAKGEIFAGLKPDGVAVIPADSPFAAYWRGLNQGRQQLTFGLADHADVRGEWQAQGATSQLQLHYQGEHVSFEVPLPGVHNAMNALAAAAASLAIGASLTAVAQGIRQFAGVHRRLQTKTAASGAQLIDDTYNANPDSMQVAIDVLQAYGGNTWFVMGDMGELGADALAMHASIGAYAKRAGIQHCWAVGTHSLAAAQAFGATARHFDQVEDLIQALKPHLGAQDVVLVKGSRFMRMERVVDALTAAIPGTE